MIIISDERNRQKNSNTTTIVLSNRPIWILAFFFSLIIIIGAFYRFGNSNYTILATAKRHIAEAVSLIILLTITFYIVLRYLYYHISLYSAKTSTVSSQVKLLFLYTFVLFLCWLPYLVICYPCSSMGWDYHWQLLQGSGVFPLSNHHPIIGSLIYGLLYKIGYLFGGAQQGLFFTSLFQALLMCFSVAFALSTLRNMGSPRWIIILLLVFFGLCPVFAGYATWLIKDSIYSSLFLILFVIIIDNLYMMRHSLTHEERTIRILCSPFNLAFVSLLCVFYRNEAVIIVALALLILVIQTLYWKRKTNNSKEARNAFIVLLIFVFAYGLEYILLTKYNVCPTNVRDSICMFSSQVARCLKEYPEDITDKEEHILENVYNNYNNLQTVADNYDETNRDHVKPSHLNFKQTRAFLKVWFQMGCRHPMLYFDTILRGSAGYWSVFYRAEDIWSSTPLYAPEEDFARIEKKNQKIKDGHYLAKEVFEYYGMDTEKTIGDYIEERNPQIEGIYTIQSAFPKERDWFNSFLAKMKKVPVLQLVFLPGFYFSILLFSIGFFCLKQKWAFFASIPIILIFVFNCFAPINGYMRYFLPVALCSMFMFGMCFIRESRVSD